ncbi:cytochrome c [Telmatospirillum siberiense]|uniref:Alcohol dehydrogenase n=1 Tax=Telmatospirillum siberiense TaxID=382514 RepID=A0A2N3PRL0_9PROT|nr:cytochrome c [Telmatospirillum siberiense]PKU23035.1 alcohol dehydrogenase [Telmatospirillum siberiense]
MTVTRPWAALLLFLAIPATALADGDSDRALVAKGEYVARTGDCLTCHTAKDGKPYAGGLPMQTPIGIIYSKNITPDKETGIGDWTYDTFARLMRTGIDDEGHSSYPAMPYPSFSRIGDDDLAALYAYFQHGVDPVRQANRKSEIPWPLSVRWPLGVWRWAFAPAVQPFQPPPQADARIARGAYLVEGPGHCGACHTPRGLALQEEALSDAEGSDYLSGGSAIDGWVPVSLRDEYGGGLAGWSASDIVALLKTGRNTHGATLGGMNDVVVHSTQYFTDEDLVSVAAYLKSLAPNKDSPPFRYDDTAAKALFNGTPPTKGAQIYVDRCGGCHRTDGKGAGSVFPSLAGNPILQTADATSAINIVLAGGAVPATATSPSVFTMAPYADVLTDQEIADVVSFIQTSWGNTGTATTREKVTSLRNTKAR